MDADTSKVQQLLLEEQSRQISELAGIASEDEKSEETTSNTLAHILLDDYSQRDNIVAGLSQQAQVAGLLNKTFVIVEDTSQSKSRKFFGQILKGPVQIQEWGSVKDGSNIYPIVSGDKVDYVPAFHGYVEIRILGEIVDGDRLENTFARPYPKSKIQYPDETLLQKLLGLPQAGGILGLLANYKDQDIKVDMTDEIVRKQLGIFGSTGSGKSNTVIVLAELLVARDWCVIIFDHSGEYTQLNESSQESRLFTERWRQLGIQPIGIRQGFRRYVPVTDKSRPAGCIKFSIRSADVPYDILKSMMDLSPAQDEKLDQLYFKERKRLEKPLSLSEIMGAVQKDLKDEDVSKQPLLRKLEGLAQKGIFDAERKKSAIQPDIFGRKADEEEVTYLTAEHLIMAKTVNVIDFGNTASQDIINLVGLNILSILERAKGTIDSPYKTKVAVFLEEAHTFFSAEYAANALFARSLTGLIRRIFKIGRKFYLNPVVISQQPGDVGAAVLSQCNTKIIHQLTDDEDIQRVGKGAAKEYVDVIPDLKTGVALITSSNFLVPQLVQIRPAMANKIDPYEQG